jgi:proteic killer suppression protein
VKLEFGSDDMRRLDADPNFDAGLSPAIVKQYRKKVGFLRGATDERDIHAWKGLHFERLKGDRAHQHSIKLNDQFRLILEIAGEGGSKVLRIVSVEDYH